MNEEGNATYRKQGGPQRCQSSWTPRCHPCRGHQCRRGRPGYARLHQSVSIYTKSSQAARRSTYAQDALGANQLDQLVLSGANGVALGIGLEVAQVTDVTLRISGSAVGLAEGVDWRRENALISLRLSLFPSATGTGP